MLDFSHLPNVQGGAETQVFRNHGQWSTWSKPRGKAMARILVAGGGGGGGGGASGASSTGRGGGGGGGSTPWWSAIIATQHLADALFIYVGGGGAGGLPASIGAVGEQSVVSLSASLSNTAHWYFKSGNVGASAGTAGTSAAGIGGAVTPSGTAAMLGQMALISYTNGQAGGNGGGVGGTGTAAFQSSFSGGCGGSGASSGEYAGSSVASSTLYVAPKGGSAGGGRGEDGYETSPAGVYLPIASIFLPGAGGGSSNLGTGGAGGNGAAGCGGGGGGAGLTGGAGGNGGPGLVMITCW